MNIEISVFCDIFPPPFVGGAEGTTKSLFDELRRINLDVSVHAITSRSEEDGVSTSRILNVYTPFSSHPSKFVRKLWHVLELFNPFEIVRCIYILKKEKPKLVLCHNSFFWSWSPIIAARLLKIPSTIFVHDYGLICFRRTLWSSSRNKECIDVCKACKVRKDSSSLIIKYAKYIFFNSNSTRNIFQKFYGAEALSQKSWVVYPTTIQQVPILDISSEVIHEKIETVGYIGRISSEKGVEDLLEVAQKMELEVHLAGDGDPTYVKSLAERYQSARFSGHLPKDDFYRNHRIVVVPSKWSEPFGKIVFEALSTGKTVVMPNHGSFLEISQLFRQIVGISLFTYIPGSLKALNDALVLAIETAQFVYLSDAPKYLKIPEWTINELAIFIKDLVN